jgi:hypothetical protein
MTEPTSTSKEPKYFYFKNVSKKQATISKKELLDELLTPEFIAEIEKNISSCISSSIKKQITKLYNKVPTNTINVREKIYVDRNTNIDNKCIIRECSNEPEERNEEDYEDAENVEFYEI